MLKEVADFIVLIRSKFYPDMFRHMVAILRGPWVPYKVLKWFDMFHPVVRVKLKLIKTGNYSQTQQLYRIVSK
jgi:hypothetical protein